jgi:hypothetical protein
MTIRLHPALGSSLFSALLLVLGCSSASDPEPGTGETGGSPNAGAGPTGVSGASTNAGAAGSGTSGNTGSTGGAPTGGTSTGGDGGANVAGASGAGGTDSPGGAGMGGAGMGGSSGSSAGMGGSSGSGAGMGGSATGGAGMGGSGGAGMGGSTSGGAPNPNDKTISMTIPAATNGQGEIRSTTTVLKNAANGGKDVWDFNNQRIGVNNTVECEGSEGQITVFELEDGVTVRNLIVAGGIHGGNGIVCKGNCTLEYVYWEDVCEDAATNSKDGATMKLNHVIALKASDKVFQHNAKAGSKTILQNSYIDTFGKLWRSCGDCTANGGPRHLEIDNVRVNGISTAVAGANQNFGDTVTIKNLFVKGGWDSSKDKPKICTEYIGVTDHDGESTKVGDGKSQWNTATCKVGQGDVKSY